MALTVQQSSPTMSLGTTPDNISPVNVLQPTTNYLGQQSGGVPLQTAGGGGGGGAGGGSGVDPSIYAYYDNMANGVQGQINALGGQQTVDQQNIDNAFQTGVNNLNASRNVANRDYTQNKASDVNNLVQQEGNIQMNTGQQTNALERLLGASGFGSSAVAQDGVPYATGLVGNQQMNGAQNNSAKNQQALDQGWGDYQTNFNNANNDLGHQHFVQTNALKASIDSNKASLLSQLSNIAQQRTAAQPGATYASIVAAGQPMQNQINTLTSDITQLGNQYANPVIATSAPAYQAPALSAYEASANPQIAMNSSSPGAASNLGVFTNMLLGANQQQTNLANQPTVAA